MMFAHTPYDGSHPLFKIGLAPLDLADWLEVDEKLDAYLAEKKYLKTQYGSRVFMAETDTQASQKEVLAMILDHLQSYHDKTHQRKGDKISAASHLIDLDSDLPELEIASQLVQEDLILMKKGENGWRLAAASLCFPSSWSLREKFSKPLDEVHRPVPGFGPGSRNAELIYRIFDNLKSDQPVRRFNWSVYSDDDLFHDDRTAEHLQRVNLEKGAFVRVEHQTLRRLEKTGDILFTVRIHINPIEQLKTHPDRQRLCAGFVSSLKSLNQAELMYKGLVDEYKHLINKLSEIGNLEDRP